MPSDTLTIEAFGSTSLVQSGNNYFLDGADGSSVELSYGGAPVVVGPVWRVDADRRRADGKRL